MSSSIPAACGLCRAALRAFAFGLIVTAAFAPAAASAAPAHPADRPLPPHFPDAVHVANGCHLSTLAFLARYTTEFPDERGKAVVVAMRNADGATRPHTLAVIGFRGDLWCRDEFFGVFPLDLRTAAEPELRRLVARIEPLLEKYARLHLARPASLRPVAAPRHLPAAEALALVRTAATILPLPARLFWIRTDRTEMPALMFRPSPTEIAVYLPAHGTCVAECNITNDARVVEIVADRLGYRDALIRADAALPGARLAIVSPAALAPSTN